MKEAKIEITYSKSKTIENMEEVKYTRFMRGSLQLLNLKSKKEKLEAKLEDVTKKLAILEETLENIIEF